MKITVLSAGQSAVKGIKAEKGQSLFIQTKDHTFLFGFGTGEIFLKNMQAMQLSCDGVDVAILPCGNLSQGGGLAAFCSVNNSAAVYARLNAFQPRYKKSFFGMKDLSLDQELAFSRRILRCRNYFASKDAAFVLFSLPAKLTGEEDAGEYFTKNQSGQLVADDFSHEMYLLTREGESWWLFCGNAYAGVADVLQGAQTLIRDNLGGKLVGVVGCLNAGMATKKSKITQQTEELINKMQQTGAEFFIAQNNGDKIFQQLKEILGDKLFSYGAGSVIERE